VLKKFKIFILLTILFFNSTLTQSVYGQNILGQSVSADEFLMNKMDLSSAVKYSLEHNNNIRAMRKNLSATERDIGISRSAMLPKLTFREDFTSTNNPTDALAYKLNQARATSADLAIDTLNHPDSVPNFLTSGTLKQTLLDKKSMILINMAKKEYSANGYAYLRFQEELVHKVAQAYLRVRTDEDLIKVDQQAINDTKAYLKIAQGSNKNKPNYLADEFRLKVAVNARELKLISAQKNYNISKRALGLLLGLENAVETASPIPEIVLQDINYYNQIAVYRNDIKSTEIRVENSKNNIKAAEADWYPTLNAAVSYNFYNSSYPFGGQGNNYFAGAYFKWELLDGNKRKYEILKAKDKAAEANEYLIGFKKAVGFKIYEIYSNIEEHQKKLEVAISTLKLAEQDVKILAERWKNSILPLVALIDLQNNLDETRASVVKNRFDLTEDLINLGFESGIIYQELGLK